MGSVLPVDTISFEEDCGCLSNVKGVGFFQAFGDPRQMASSGVSYPYLDSQTVIKRLLRRSNPALPNIWRFSILSLLFNPSTTPLLQSVFILAFTAA